MQTKSKSQIKKEAKFLVKDLRNIYNKLDNLMNESKISSEGCTENEVIKGKSDEFNKYAVIIESSRDYVNLAFDYLEIIN